jgi:hypothetical protein
MNLSSAMMIKSWHEDAWADYLYWQTQDTTSLVGGAHASMRKTDWFFALLARRWK